MPFALMLALACSPPATSHEEVEMHEAPAPPIEAAAAGGTELRTVYVPAYSHLPRGRGIDPKTEILLSILLSIRNVDTSSPVTLTQVEYFDTDGAIVRRYLRKPRVLQPLETAEFSVQNLDKTGGSGANFLLHWEGPADAHPLLSEAVMLGQEGNGQFAFTSRGVELDRRVEPSAAPPAAEQKAPQ